MLVRAPLVEAEQDRSIRIEDLTKVSMARLCLGLAEERLVPFEASRHIAYADDRPRAFHYISPVGMTRCASAVGRAEAVADHQYEDGLRRLRRSVRASSKRSLGARRRLALA